jgi:hypothetical protein
MIHNIQIYGDQLQKLFINYKKINHYNNKKLVIKQYFKKPYLVK